MICPPIAFLETIGGGEILIIAVIVLLMFGPKRLPEIARMLGRTSAHFNKAFQDFKDQLMQSDQPEEPPEESPPEDKGKPNLPEEYADPTRKSDKPADDPSGPPDESDPPEPPRAG